jgi:parallel beta-helix repeat protein
LNRLVVIGIIFLFVCSSVIPISGFNLEQSSGNIITVDNEGDGDYTSIKQALNNVNPWDTIEVYSGTYFERGIKVEKEGITFQGISHELGNGSDTGKPFIDGEGINYVFMFKAKKVTLDGFHIENGGQPTSHNMVVIASDEGTVSNNELFYSSSTIIWVEKSKNNKIINNNISHSSRGSGIGFYLTSRNHLISGNNISLCEEGILLWGSNNHTIIGNRITNCSEYGVDFATGDVTIFEGNHIEGNRVGIDLLGSMNVSIKNNNFVDNWQNIFYVTELGWVRKMFKSVKFERNYYDDWIGIGPKPIWGVIWLIPIALVLNIDWHPVRKPYDI